MAKEIRALCAAGQNSNGTMVAKLLSLLEDEPFRVVMQQGLDSDSEYSGVTECLKAQYNPDGNELEWQAKFNIGCKNQMNSGTLCA